MMQKHSLQHEMGHAGMLGSSFIPWKEVLSQKLHILCRGHFHTFRDPKGADQLSPRDSATNLLMLQPCWNMVAVHQPSLTPPIWTIQGCTALVSEQNCFSLHIFLGPLELFLLVSIG